MKKIISILMLLAIMISFVGCAVSNETKETSETNETNETNETTTIHKQTISNEEEWKNAFDFDNYKNCTVYTYKSNYQEKSLYKYDNDMYESFYNHNYGFIKYEYLIIKSRQLWRCTPHQDSTGKEIYTWYLVYPDCDSTAFECGFSDQYFESMSKCFDSVTYHNDGYYLYNDSQRTIHIYFENGLVSLLEVYIKDSLSESVKITDVGTTIVNIPEEYMISFDHNYYFENNIES